MTKTCTKCGETKPLSEFFRDRRKPDGLTSWCRVCRAEYARRYRETHRDELLPLDRERYRRYRQANRGEVIARERQRRIADPEGSRERARRHHERLRAAVFDHYGRACTCCGSPDCLTLDHVNGGGGRDRKEHGYGTSFYRWLIKSGFPGGMQVLCQPCNASKGTGARCRLDHGGAP